jgi:hypothetical protein
MTLLWTIGTCLFGVYVLGGIARRKAAEARRRARTSGEIVKVQEFVGGPAARAIGLPRATHVVVRTDDDQLVLLTNPPHPDLAVGDRISGGMPVREDDAGDH